MFQPTPFELQMTLLGAPTTRLKNTSLQGSKCCFFCTHPFSGHNTVNCDQVWVSPKPTNGSWGGGGLNSIWKRLGIKPVRQATALNTLNKVMIINYLGGLLFALRYHQSFWRGVWLSYPTFSLVHLSSSVTFVYVKCDRIPNTLMSRCHNTRCQRFVPMFVNKICSQWLFPSYIVMWHSITLTSLSLESIL